MIYKHLILIVFIFFTIHSQCSNTYNDSIVNNVFASIYNQQFSQAEALLTQNKMLIDPFYAEVLTIDLHWWKYSISRSKDNAKRLTTLLNNSNNSYSNSKENKINQLIKKSYQLRYERKRYNLIRVVILRSEISQMLNEINNNQLPVTGNQLKLFDLYMTMFLYFKNVNPFTITSNNSKKENYLTKISSYTLDDNLVLNTTAHYFLGRIYQKVTKDARKGKNHFEVLTRKFPENKLFVEYLEDCERKI